MTPARHAPTAHLLLRCTCRPSDRLGQGCDRENDTAVEIAQVRARLDLPIIDSEGHTFELPPLFMEYLESAAGTKVVERFETAYFDTFADPRRSHFLSRSGASDETSGQPSGPCRHAIRLTSQLRFSPKRMYERLPEMGLDFSVVYPTMGLVTIELQDEELRRASARAQSDEG